MQQAVQYPRVVHFLTQCGSCRVEDTQLTAATYSPHHDIFFVPEMVHQSEGTQSSELLTLNYRAQVNSSCTLEPWQHQFKTNCNDFHILDLPALLEDNRFGLLGQGAYRTAWVLQQHEVVFKTLNANKKFTDVVMKKQINDAIASEHTISSRVVGIHGFCGTSVFNELASGGTLTERIVEMGIPKTSTNTTEWNMTWKDRLIYAVQAARALVDLHSSRIDDLPQILHGDLSPDNFVLANGTLKLNDLNRASLIGRENGQPCSFKRKYHNPHFSAPEEAEHQDLHYPVEIFSFGSVLFSLLTGGNYPFQDVPEPNATNELLSEGHAEIPDFVMASKDPLVHRMSALVLECWKRDPFERPSALNVSLALESIVASLQA